MNQASGAVSALIGQITRYGVTGLIATAIQSAVYWLLATYAGMAPLAANVFGYIAAVAAGYVLHSQWSFKGHGRRDNPARTTSRFVLVSLISFALNSFFVWLLTGVLEGPTWWPIIPFFFVTPVVTFMLHRHWVFR
jgi:putative flippase GtrA